MGPPDEKCEFMMFSIESTREEKRFRLAIIGLSVLSAAALAVTVWIMIDFLREQSIVDSLVLQLPPQARQSAEYLAGELRWQFRLSMLVILNLVVTAIAVLLLWRAYRASQTSLRDVQALASDIIGSMEQGVITTDLSGTVTSINSRGLELLGAKKRNVGDSIEQLSRLALGEYREDWLSNRSADSPREFVNNKNGQSQTLRAFCQTLRNRDGNEMGSVMQIRDITERKLIEERMRRMERYMGLGSLAGGLHHEIKNPLAALSLHVQLLEEQLTSKDTPDDVKSMLEVIGAEVKRIGSVLEAFRDFASIDQLNLATLDLKALVAQQIALMNPRAEQQKVQIQFDGPSQDFIVEADRTRLEQVILNLIVNAIEAMPDGGDLTVRLFEDEDSACIEVADTGCGIPANLRDKILDPYFTTKTGGTGLGLAFCDKILRQHVGSLDFETSSKGTNFHLCLPKQNAQ